jgi:Na+/H+ antiporter NhaD/arsenite permease-like protein
MMHGHRHLALAIPLGVLALLLPGLSLASGSANWIDLTTHPVGYSALIIFVLAYALVMAEEFLHLRKSKPVIIAAGIIWAMIAYVYVQQGFTHEAEAAVRHNLLEYAELMLFLLVAMTYINAMQERQVFDALRAWLIHKGFGFRALFWITGWSGLFDLAGRR